MNSQTTAYRNAQLALANLKGSVLELLGSGFGEGLTNSEIGRALGIYQGHVGHEGHIPRTLLAIMEAEGVVRQDRSTKRWRLNGVTSEDPGTKAPLTDAPSSAHE